MKQNISRTCEKSTAIPSAATPGWPPSLVEDLRRHWNAGLTTSEIAARLGKSARAVECKVYKLRVRGVVLPARRGGGAHEPEDQGRAGQQASRLCLYCRKQFNSSHPGNRICAPCLEDGPFTSAML